MVRGVPSDARQSRALTYITQAYRQFVESRAPMLQLPPSLAVDRNLAKEPWYCGPIKVIFGFGITRANLISYAKRAGLFYEKKLSKSEEVQQMELSNVVLFLVPPHLEYKTSTLKIHIRRPLHAKYDYVVGLYDNWTQADEQFVAEDEKEILDILRAELEIGDEEPPMWYFLLWDDD